MMMRRTAVLMIFVMMLIALPVVAQDGQIVWDFSDDTLQVTDLGFEFNYPRDWLFDNSNGLAFSEDQDSITAFLDTDDSTQPSSDVLTVRGIGLSSIEGGTDSTLDAIIDYAEQVTGFTETEPRGEVAVMGRRAVYIVGYSDDEKVGELRAYWKQPDYLVEVALAAAAKSLDYNKAFTFGTMLSSFSPLGAQELSDNTVDISTAGLKVHYPKGWYPSPDNPNIAFALKADLKAENPTGLWFVAFEQSMDDLGLNKKATLDDVVEADITGVAMEEPIRREEFIIAGQPAIVLRGIEGSGAYILYAQALIEGQAVQIAVIAQDEQQLDEFEPTFLRILMSVEAA
jgi:hypothetical protein